MASSSSPSESPLLSPLSFADFPEDVQLAVLSFLSPPEIASFASTSRRFASLCAQPRLWLSICDRRWGARTRVRSWAGGRATSDGDAPFRRLYRALERWENLIGFWRRIGHGSAGAPPLVFFEWGPSFISGSRVFPSTDAGSYGAVKVPFLWMGLSQQGDPVGFLRYQPDGRLRLGPRVGRPSDSELVPVTVSFMGENHLVVEENRSFYLNHQGKDDLGISITTSAPDWLISEIYQYFAGQTGTGGEGAARRQKKRERERLGRRRWEAEHFVKIVNCYPTPSRPLQGLWKGICENMNLDFFLVTYDDIGGIACRRVGDGSEPFSSYSPVFWTSNTAFLEFPFPREEEDIYNSREHIRSVVFSFLNTEKEAVSRILRINSSYDLVIPDLYASSTNLQNVEGRIWEYKSGTFGFGFFRNNFIIDLKRIALNGRLLDAIE